MGLFEPDDIPKPAIVNLDPGTQKLMSDAYDRSTQSSGDISKEAYDPAAALGQQSYSSNDSVAKSEQRSGGLMDPNMISAIRSKQGQMLGQRLTNLKQQTDMNAFNQRSDRLRFAQNAFIAKQKIDNQNYERLLRADNNEKEIRAGVLKSWMSVAGAVVGGIYGGPMGAAAGSQVGSGAGSMMTGRSGQAQELDFGADVTMPSGGRSYSGGTTQNDFLNGGGMGNYGSSSGSGRY